MPRIPYEEQTFFINLALPVNGQALESAPASTSTFALNNATRQPRRRAESMPWNHQASILRFCQNSLQLKLAPKALPIPHFIQAEHDRDSDIEMGNGLGDMGQEIGHNYLTT